MSSRPAKPRDRGQIALRFGDRVLRGKVVVVRGRTLPHQGFLWGLRFVHLSKDTRSQLALFVQQALANAARVRQAQLFSPALRGGRPEPQPAAGMPPASPHAVDGPTPAAAPVHARSRDRAAAGQDRAAPQPERPAAQPGAARGSRVGGGRSPSRTGETMVPGQYRVATPGKHGEPSFERAQSVVLEPPASDPQPVPSPRARSLPSSFPGSSTGAPVPTVKTDAASSQPPPAPVKEPSASSNRRRREGITLPPLPRRERVASTRGTKTPDEVPAYELDPSQLDPARIEAELLTLNEPAQPSSGTAGDSPVSDNLPVDPFFAPDVGDDVPETGEGVIAPVDPPTPQRDRLRSRGPQTPAPVAEEDYDEERTTVALSRAGFAKHLAQAQGSEESEVVARPVPVATNKTALPAPVGDIESLETRRRESPPSSAQVQSVDPLDEFTDDEPEQASVTYVELDDSDLLLVQESDASLSEPAVEPQESTPPATVPQCDPKQPTALGRSQPEPTELDTDLLPTSSTTIHDDDGVSYIDLEDTQDISSTDLTPTEPQPPSLVEAVVDEAADAQASRTSPTLLGFEAPQMGDEFVEASTEPGVGATVSDTDDVPAPAPASSGLGRAPIAGAGAESSVSVRPSALVRPPLLDLPGQGHPVESPKGAQLEGLSGLPFEVADEDDPELTFESAAAAVHSDSGAAPGAVAGEHGLPSVGIPDSDAPDLFPGIAEEGLYLDSSPSPDPTFDAPPVLPRGSGDVDGFPGVPEPGLYGQAKPDSAAPTSDLRRRLAAQVRVEAGVAALDQQFPGVEEPGLYADYVGSVPPQKSIPGEAPTLEPDPEPADHTGSSVETSSIYISEVMPERLPAKAEIEGELVEDAAPTDPASIDAPPPDSPNGGSPVEPTVLTDRESAATRVKPGDCDFLSAGRGVFLESEKSDPLTGFTMVIHPEESRVSARTGDTVIFDEPGAMASITPPPADPDQVAPAPEDSFDSDDFEAPVTGATMVVSLEDLHASHSAKLRGTAEPSPPFAAPFQPGAFEEDVDTSSYGTTAARTSDVSPEPGTTQPLVPDPVDPSWTSPSGDAALAAIEFGASGAKTSSRTGGAQSPQGFEPQNDDPLSEPPELRRPPPDLPGIPRPPVVPPAPAVARSPGDARVERIQTAKTDAPQSVEPTSDPASLRRSLSAGGQFQGLPGAPLKRRGKTGGGSATNAHASGAKTSSDSDDEITRKALRPRRRRARSTDSDHRILDLYRRALQDLKSSPTK